MIRAIVLFLLLSTSAATAEVRISSGEHKGFSRLVFDLEDLRKWKLTPITDGVELFVDGADFDLSRAFDRIPKTRITGMTVTDPGRLHITTACSCTTTTFEIRPGLIVIDFNDEQIEAAERPGNLFPLRSVNAPSLATNEKALWRKFQSESLRRTLTLGLKEAADRGTVNLVDPGTTQTNTNLPTSTLESGRNIKITNETYEPETTKDDEVSSCQPDHLVEISSWGEDFDFSEQLSRAQNAIAAELDQPSPDSILSAARTYLYLGLSTEALHLLKVFEADAEQHAVLKTIASIMEARPQEKSVFFQMTSCENMSSFWALLATEHNLPDDFEIRPALGHYKGLPLHLRILFADRMIEIAKASDDLAALQIVKNAIERSALPLDDVSKVSVAETYRLLGDDAAAETMFKDLAKTYGPAEAEALIGLVAVQLRKKEPTDQNTIDSLSGLLTANLNTPLEAELADALAIGLALSGNFKSAFANLRTGSQAGQDIWKLLVESGNDDDFLVLAANTPADATKIKFDTRAFLSERLLSLGFADPARDWRPEAFKPGASDLDRLFAGKVLIELHDSKAALEKLAGLNSSDAINAKARAYLQLGNYSEAIKILQDPNNSVDQTKKSLQEQPQSGKITPDARPQLTINPDELRKRLEDPSLFAVSQETPTLSASQTLLDESKKLRSKSIDVLRSLPGTEN